MSAGSWTKRSAAAVGIGVSLLAVALQLDAQVFTENFDGVAAPELPAGWVSTALGDVPTPWVTDPANADSAPNAAHVHDPISDLTNATLDSPSIAVGTADAQLTFRHAFAFATGPCGGAPKFRGAASSNPPTGLLRYRSIPAPFRNSSQRAVPSMRAATAAATGSGATTGIRPIRPFARTCRRPRRAPRSVSGGISSRSRASTLLSRATGGSTRSGSATGTVRRDSATGAPRRGHRRQWRARAGRDRGSRPVLLQQRQRLADPDGWVRRLRRAAGDRHPRPGFHAPTTGRFFRAPSVGAASRATAMRSRSTSRPRGRRSTGMRSCGRTSPTE